MAFTIPADTPVHPAEARAPAEPAAGPWTPARHIAEGVTKPTRLLELGTGEHGKTALLEFPGGWQRTIDLPTEADAWHPLFSELPQADVQRLRKHVAHPIIRHPDGTRTRRGALSFVTEEVGPAGGYKAERCFDVPQEDFYSGCVTGYRCAAELLEAWRVATGRTSSSNTSSRKHCKPVVNPTASHPGAVQVPLSWRLSVRP